VEFRHFVQLIAIGLQARIPMHMTGFPGVGKTEFTKSLEAGFDRVGIKCKVVVLVGRSGNHRTSAAFRCRRRTACACCRWPGRATAQRLAEDGYLVVVFLDELTTVPPTTQAAMLRLLTENVCGELRLPDYEPGKGGVVYLCASNAVEWAAGTGNPGADGEPVVARRVPDGSRDVVRFDGQRLSGAGQHARAAGRLSGPIPSRPTGDDCRVREGRRS